jgi:hypothetical protein
MAPLVRLLAFTLAVVACHGPVFAAPRAANLQRALFKPRPSSTPGGARFAVIGDGGTGDSGQSQIAAALSKTHATSPFASLVLLGDNVYPEGDPRRSFDAVIKTPYSPLLSRGVKLFGILGNHDVLYDGGRAQLRYLGNGGRRYYRTLLPGGDVELFALDSTVLVDPAEGSHASRSAWAAKEAAKQVAWLDKALATSTARFKIVVGHHPLYTAGKGKREPERALMRTAIEPLLVKHGVAAYLAGHEHLYSRTSPVNGITHFTSGGGAYASKREPDTSRDIAVVAKQSHYMLFEAQGDKLSFEVRGADGRSLDRGSISAPR